MAVIMIMYFIKFISRAEKKLYLSQAQFKFPKLKNQIFNILRPKTYHNCNNTEIIIIK